MKAEELSKLNEVVGILSNYPTNYQAKALLGQITRFINNNRGNRFQKTILSNAGILEGSNKPVEIIQEESRISLMDAKRIRESQDESDENVLATSETIRKTRRKKAE
jgi:hypothetical protein